MERSVSLRVVDAIAAKEGVPPSSLQPPLASVIDPTALDSLFDPTTGRQPRRACFHYPGYHVEVTSDREVSVQPADPVEPPVEQ